MGIPEGEGGEKGTEGISETIMTKDFSNARHQTADPGSAGNTKQDKDQNNYSSNYHFQIIENQR